MMREMTNEPEVDAKPLGAHDWIAGLVVLALFIAMLAATWNRWTHPIIDHGREMNVPARILAGDRLYLDIYYYYGPIAPYLGAALYSLLGIHLAVLHASGIVCAIVILTLIYWIARQLLNVVEAALTTSLVLVLCALPSYMGNYVQPYAYAALYGWTFSLGALACAVRSLTEPHGRWFLYASVCVGAAMACKPELGVQAALPAATAWVVSCLQERRWLWRPLGWLSLPAVVMVVLTYGPIALVVPWRRLFGQTILSFTQPQMIYFAQWLNGRLQWPETGWAMVASVGLCVLACGMSALGGLVLDCGMTPTWRRHGWWIGCLVVVGWCVWMLLPGGSTNVDVSPFRSAPLVLGAAIGVSAWRFLRPQAKRAWPPTSQHVLLLVSLFSLLSTGRVLFNVSLLTPYTIFTVPTLIVVYTHLFQRAWPALLPTPQLRMDARRAGVGLMAVAVGVMALHHAIGSRARYGAEIRAPRGTLLTSQELAGPFNEAIRFVRAETASNEAVVTLPEGSLINFMAERPNPLPDEIIVPGYLTGTREQETIRRIDQAQVRLILLLNRLTPEYRDVAFGVDYNQDLMRWIESRYRPVATFGGKDGEGSRLHFGAGEFFIRAYERQAP
jgi:hypothetical protein